MTPQIHVNDESDLIPAPRVYVINHSGLDYEKAERFGTLVYLTRGYIDVVGIKDVLDRIWKKFDSQGVEKSSLSNSQKTDYLLLSGSTILCILTCFLWYKKHKHLNLLVHNKKLDDYKRVVINDFDWED